MGLTLRNSFPTATGTDEVLAAFPTGIQANDLLLMEVTTAADVDPMSLPGGFFPVPGARITGTTHTQVVWKIADGSEAGNTYRVRALGTDITVGMIAIAATTLAYAEVHQAATQSSNTANATKTWASVTNVATNTLLLCFGGFGSSAGSTPNAGMSERWDTSNPRIYLQTEVVSGAGATGARTATGSSVATQRCITISVAETATMPTLLPQWWENRNINSAGDVLTYLSTDYKRSITNSVSDDSTAGSSGQDLDLLIVPHPRTKRIKIKADYSAYRHKTGPSSAIAMGLGLGNDGHTTRTDDFSYSTPAYDVQLTGSCTIEWTNASSTADWYENTTTVPPTALQTVRLTTSTLNNAVGAGNTADSLLTWSAEIVEIEFFGGAIWYPAGINVTEALVYAELTGAGVRTTQAMLYAELAAKGIYVTEAPLYAEVGAVGIYVTAAPLYIELEYQEPVTIMPTVFPANQGTRRMHTALPEEVSGYAFDPEYSWWSTIVAEESTNHIINPSFETDNEGEYVGSGWSLYLNGFRYNYSPVGATRGRACLRLATNTADAYLAYDAGIQVTPGPWTFSCDIYVTVVGRPIFLAIMEGTTVVARRQFMPKHSGWQRYQITYVELGSGLRKPRIGIVGSWGANVLIYTDAWQFENKKYATTYLDGDMVGFNDSQPNQSYYWQGQPHRSKSTRRARTGSGGRVVSWSQEAHFKTTSLVGLGMTTVEQTTQTLGDGREVHLSMMDKPRDFTITGRIFAGDHRELLMRRNDLIRLLKHNNTVGSDQMMLRFQEVDDNEQLVGAPLDITCVYREGMQGQTTNLYQENLPLQFRAVNPFPADIIESSARLLLNKTLVDNGLIFRDEDGEFTNLGTGSTLGGVVARVGFLRDGRVIGMGNFTQIGGDVVVYNAYWDGVNWQPIGTGGPPDTNDIDDGYRLGYPLTVGAQSGDVWEYDDVADSWSTLGSQGFLGSIQAIQRDTNGDIWVGGSFDFADDGTTKFRNVAKWNTATEMWETVGGGLSDPYDINDDPMAVWAVLASNDGSVYFGGSFGDAFADMNPFPGEVLAKGVARWDIATGTWHRVGTGLGGTVKHLLTGIDGYIYAVGNFATDAGLTPYDIRGFARFNGHNWEEVFALVNQDGVYGADGVLQDNDGIFWFYNFVDDPDHDLFVVEGLGEVGFFGWRDGIFYPPYMDRTGMLHMAIGPGNRTMHSTHAYTVGPDQIVPALNRIQYYGSADAPVAIHIHGSGYPTHILNLSTEGGVYGKGDFLLSANEEMVLRTDSQRNLVYSNQRRNLSTQLSGGASNMKALRLRPGENRISILVTQTADESADGWMAWKNHFVSLQEGLV